MHPSLSETGHRPWPLPAGAWQWRQTWSDLAFLHYRIAANRLEGKIPAGLALETYDGSAWVSVVPFRMEDVAPRTLPSPPPLKSFYELNLRTYVTNGNKPGVWFFSLDANCTPMVLGGRMLYGLPYFRATIDLKTSGGVYTFSSQRWSNKTRFDATYAPGGPVFRASPGSFEHWITERYCLYALRRGQLTRTEVHHRPWPLQKAEVEVQVGGLFQAASIQPYEEPPTCHFSTGVNVISFSPKNA